MTAPSPEAIAADRAWVRRSLLRMAVGLVVLLTAVAVFVALYEEPIRAASQRFVEVAGGPGIALGWFLPDVAPLPILPDAFTTAGLIGGMGFLEVVLWGTLGSIAGGSAGYAFGRLLPNTAMYQRVMAGRGARAGELVERYGAAALAFAALSPLPFSLACWAAGALAMPLPRFFAVAALRFVRISSYLYLLQLGFVG